MIKKLRTNWLSIALAIVVIVSLLLSYVIWTNPFQYEHPRHDNAGNQSQQLTTQSIGDMYLPTTIVKTNQNNKQNLLYSRKTDLMLEMRKQIRHWHFNRANTVKTDNSDVYLSYLRQRNSLILSYPDEISGTVFNQTFSQSIDSNRVKHINHIVIPLNGSNIYLLSDYHYQIYRFHLSRNSNKKLEIAKKTVQPIPVNYKIVNGQAVMVYPHGLQLPMLGYQVSNQKIDSLSTNLMSSKQHTSISSNRSGVERYWLSLYTVQVPLPLDQQTVKLPSTTTVLNQLHSSGRFKDLRDLRVGYLWKSDQTKVVKLVPTYFVKYRGNWVDYTELLK